MNDTASLQNLNDIVAPAAVPWWPLAPGVYMVLLIVAVTMLWFAISAWRRRQRNRYRRQALAALAAIRAGSDESLFSLPELLKRTALSAWPRNDVASLSGTAWHRFLDETAGMGLFCGGVGELLDQLAYHGERQAEFSKQDQNRLIEAAETWMKRHRTATGAD
ncbi:MAG: DUF4381 domain-containing protein [Xanthomonadales bacterium]|jgi:hypothetical protein|nr:DUF4381 domain-containing protein [Xanthomonadales bacterium]MDH3939696.1 DUF4381 domain-containing protein [Xanthomonadales bacterium]MDH4002324.1 DUF4381 domain-containing protein [Xanthomonadales bacterium]